MSFPKSTPATCPKSTPFFESVDPNIYKEHLTWTEPALVSSTRGRCGSVVTPRWAWCSASRSPQHKGCFKCPCGTKSAWFWMCFFLCGGVGMGFLLVEVEEWGALVGMKFFWILFWTMWGEWPQVPLKRASDAIVNSSRTVVFQRFQQSVMLVCWLTMAMIWLYCQHWPKGEVEVLIVWNVRAIAISAISWTTSRQTKFGSKTRTFLR